MISGTLEFFKPELDPASAITVTDLPGKPKLSLSHPSLTAAQIQMTVYSKEEFNKEVKADQETLKTQAGKGTAGKDKKSPFLGYYGPMFGGNNSIIMYVQDPQSKIIRIEFMDASGNVISPRQRSTSGHIRSYGFDEPLPLKAQLRVYVETPKSVVKTPLELKDIILP